MAAKLSLSQVIIGTFATGAVSARTVLFTGKNYPEQMAELLIVRALRMGRRLKLALLH